MNNAASDPDRLLPYPDRDSQPWWDALALHQLQVQRCTECEVRRWPARALCSACASLDWTWEQVEGDGTVLSRTTTHHAFLPGFATPYHTVLVRVALPGSSQDDIVIPGGWAADSTPAVGERVMAAFDDVSNGDESMTLLMWRPA